jgi:CubicO group peptidase (beta-lactamase class C family)
MTTPIEAGRTAELRRRLDEALRTDRVPGLDGVVVTHRGRLVLEHYGTGPDFQWGTSLGTVGFGPDTLHDLRSVTKSIVGLLYGIALEAGRVPDRRRRCSPSSPSIPRSPPIRDVPGSGWRTR